jgi:para-aminobenzoate synthetase/4-amino-4-deoxychorismate lyase
MAEGRARFGSGARQAWDARLDAPADVRRAETLADVTDTVRWVEGEARAGRWGVLLLAYEAAPAFDDALVVQRSSGPVPLAWAASYPDQTRDDATPPASAVGHAAVSPAWQPRIDAPRFGRDIAAILAAIAAGDTYQVNYTFPLEAAFDADPWTWYEAVAAQAMVPFAACIDVGEAIVMSLSPELFVERRGRRVTTRPMKGTMRRGRWPQEDARIAAELLASDKARAENVMIVDLLRNDLGRVADVGSVQVSDLCRLERYPTVWQLTSTVSATVRHGVDLVDLLRATFPCGSVTGAPKVRTMEIIAALESAPRGIYTGMIALLEPGGDVVSSVPIRTAVLDRVRQTACFHVGAGITADSVADEEWAECLAKARVVRAPAVPPGAALFETLRLEDGTLFRRNAHLARLAGSADLFGWKVDLEKARTALDAVTFAHPEGLWRVRLTATRNGRCAAEAVRFEDDSGPWRVRLAPTPVDVRSPLLFNKTTSRAVYETARAAWPDADDVLLWNARRELTETTVGNLVVELGGRRVTPPVSCGLLPGVMREAVLADGLVQERVVRVEELPEATALWLVNSLRGWVRLAVMDGTSRG